MRIQLTSTNGTHVLLRPLLKKREEKEMTARKAADGKWTPFNFLLLLSVLQKTKLLNKRVSEQSFNKSPKKKGAGKE